MRHLSEREQSFKTSQLESSVVFFSSGARIVAVKRAIDDRMEDRSPVERVEGTTAMLTTSAAIANELTLQHGIRASMGAGITVL